MTREVYHVTKKDGHKQGKLTGADRASVTAPTNAARGSLILEPESRGKHFHVRPCGAVTFSCLCSINSRACDRPSCPESAVASSDRYTTLADAAAHRRFALHDTYAPCAGGRGCAEPPGQTGGTLNAQRPSFAQKKTHQINRACDRPSAGAQRRFADRSPEDARGADL